MKKAEVGDVVVVLERPPFTFGGDTGSLIGEIGVVERITPEGNHMANTPQDAVHVTTCLSGSGLGEAVAGGDDDVTETFFYGHSQLLVIGQIDESESVPREFDDESVNSSISGGGY